ncbi:WD40 repeat-like protein [Lophium mytilinum]|uniref:WD40 repeat-like protein n=1 Tax=Lophium mytilinum TaxID=390894 RepID=A0A6A6QB62_9PEZI|nr:WD40 repeat-like protein [Lophium mytilinum]
MAHHPADLPSLRSTVRLGGRDSDIKTPWFDAKFYPYTPPGVDPVFAVVGDRDTVVCRCVLEKGNSIEVLLWFKDEEEAEEWTLNSLEWAQAENGDPLICITGSVAKIKVLNVKTGELETTLTGHGALINDLAISPLNPRILASGSMDHSIRIWSLDPSHKKNPTMVKCGGGGHKEGILAVGFHRNGRYLLSGGMDTMVNLWVLPELPNNTAGTDKTTLVHYPHFSTTEIHTDFVDCIRFYGDLIISRSAKENKILLWRIDGFNSDDPFPAPSEAPIPPFSSAHVSHTKHQTQNTDSSGTRSAWPGRFQRLLQFDAPLTTLFYMRFGLFHELGHSPILAMGNEKSRIFFWDLKRLESGDVGRVSTKVKSKSKKGKEKESLARVREESIAESATSGASEATSAQASSLGSFSVSGKGKGKAAVGPGTAKAIGDPFFPIPAHKSVVVPKVNFATRQIAWSRGGEWCVVVGDCAMICLFQR